MVLEHIVVLLVDPGPDLVFAPLLVIKLKILAPFWATSTSLAHLIFAPAWERYVVLY